MNIEKLLWQMVLIMAIVLCLEIDYITIDGYYAMKYNPCCHKINMWGAVCIISWSHYLTYRLYLSLKKQ